MRKIMLFCLSLLATTGFAEKLVLENQTSYPIKNQTKIAIQWASSTQEVEEGNHAIIHGLKLNPKSLQVLTESGRVLLNIPKKAEFFRVLAWSKKEGKPDFLTNWIDIVPNKTYTLKEDHLVPSVLMLGTGC